MCCKLLALTLPCTGHDLDVMSCAGRLGGLDWPRLASRAILSQTPAAYCWVAVDHSLRKNPKAIDVYCVCLASCCTLTLHCTGHDLDVMSCAGRLGGLDWPRLASRAIRSQTPAAYCWVAVDHSLRKNPKAIDVYCVCLASCCELTLPCTGHDLDVMLCAGRLGGLDWPRLASRAILSQTPAADCCVAVDHSLRKNPKAIDVFSVCLASCLG